WCPSDLVSVCRLVDSTVLAERGVALPLPDVVLKTGPANLVVQRAVTHGGKHRTDGARVTTRRDNGRRAPRRRPRPRVAPRQAVAPRYPRAARAAGRRFPDPRRIE